MEIDIDLNNVSADFYASGEPDFSGPPINSLQFRSYIDSGTFISFLEHGNTVLGRIISTASLVTTGMIKINRGNIRNHRSGRVIVLLPSESYGPAQPVGCRRALATRAYWRVGVAKSVRTAASGRNRED